VVTIRDVARHAGVSPATVSRVVNGLVCYSDETRERVENAVKSLSYETDYLARGLKTRQTSVIGLLAPMVSDALASQVMQGVEEEVQERGYAAMLGRTGAKPAFIAGYLRTLRTYRAAGVILISAVITPETRQLLGPNIPIISVAIGDKSGSPSVAIDDEQAAYDATSHLLRLGHRRIGLLTGDPASVHVAQPRERGYLRAMTEAGCTPVTATGSFFYESGAAGVDELLQQEPGLTAIFAMSDEMSAAVVNELQRRGHRVPEDVSVLGFDNTSTARHVNPPLSTTAQPLEEMGRMAVKSCSAPATWRRRQQPVRTGQGQPPLLRYPHQFAGSVGLGRFCLVVNGLVLGTASSVAAISGSFPSGLPPGVSSRIDGYFHSPDRIDAGARGTFVADCRITSSVRAPWLSEWKQASQAAKAAVAG
jgi:DNA-binding LacI/PurR family transcriptional regulator